MKEKIKIRLWANLIMALITSEILFVFILRYESLARSGEYVYLKILYSIVFLPSFLGEDVVFILGMSGLGMIVYPLMLAIVIFFVGMFISIVLDKVLKQFNKDNSKWLIIVAIVLSFYLPLILFTFAYTGIADLWHILLQ